MLDPSRSQGLPPFLSQRAGTNSGFMVAHYTAASLAEENRRLALPASVGSLPASAMQEDHNSMGWSAGRKLRAIVENLGRILAIEAICAAPGVDAVYIGPSDLALALGGDQPSAAATLPDYEPALERVRTVAEKAGIAVGIHCPDGQAAARAFAAGFTMATVANDLNHLAAIAATHLAAARGDTS